MAQARQAFFLLALFALPWEMVMLPPVNAHELSLGDYSTKKLIMDDNFRYITEAKEYMKKYEANKNDMGPPVYAKVALRRVDLTEEIRHPLISCETGA